LVAIEHICRKFDTQTENGIPETEVQSYYSANKSNMAAAAVFNFSTERNNVATDLGKFAKFVEILRAIIGNMPGDQNSQEVNSRRWQQPFWISLNNHNSVATELFL